MSFPGNKKRILKQCMADKNTVCECKTGFYCSDADCEHCLPVKRCPVGEGVEVHGRYPHFRGGTLLYGNKYRIMLYKHQLFILT